MRLKKGLLATAAALALDADGGPSPTPITMTKVGEFWSTTNVSSIAVATSAAVPAGAHLIVLGGLPSSGVPTVSDGTNNLTNTLVMSDTEYTGRVFAAFRHYPSGLASGTTITLSSNVTSILQMTILAVTGLATSPLDQQTVGNSGAASTALTTVATGTLAQANSLAIAFARVQSGGSDAAFTQPSGWTAFGRTTAGAGEVSLDGGYQVTTTTAALTYATTLPSARNWTVGTVVFKGA